MTHKWFNLNVEYLSNILGKNISFTCYLCNEALLVKELDDNYFHENCYDILKKLISKKICEDIWNIIIYKVQ